MHIYIYIFLFKTLTFFSILIMIYVPSSKLIISRPYFRVSPHKINQRPCCPKIIQIRDTYISSFLYICAVGSSKSFVQNYTCNDGGSIFACGDNAEVYILTGFSLQLKCLIQPDSYIEGYLHR